MMIQMMMFEDDDCGLQIISINLKIGYKRKKCHRGKCKFVLRTIKKSVFAYNTFRMGLT